MTEVRDDGVAALSADWGRESEEGAGVEARDCVSDGMGACEADSGGGVGAGSWMAAPVGAMCACSSTG